MNSNASINAQLSDRTFTMTYKGYEVPVGFRNPRLSAKWIRSRDDDRFIGIDLPSCLAVISDKQAESLAVAVMDACIEHDETGRWSDRPKEMMYELARVPGVRIRWLLDNGGCIEPTERAAKVIESALWAGEDAKVLMTDTGAGVVAESRTLQALVVGRRIPSEKLREAVRRVAGPVFFKDEEVE